MIKIGVLLVFIILIGCVTNVLSSKPRRKFFLPAGEYFTVLVDLEDCEVLASVNRQEEFVPDVMTPFGEIVNPRMYDNRRGEIQTPMTYVRFKYNGREFIGGPFKKSREGVIVEFMNKKNATLYISKNDASNYYFDLNFLENE